MPGHQLCLLQGAQVFFDALVSDIERASHEVRLETYIFDIHGAGARVAQALIDAARRGVSVYVVMDGVGTPQLPAPWPQQMDAVGVHWVIFSPLGKLGLLVPNRWRRLHRKLCVVDGKLAYCGGINVLDDWWDPRYGSLEAPRFDFTVRISGPVVREVHAAMLQFWWRFQAARSVKQVDWAGARQALQLAADENHTTVPTVQTVQSDQGALAQLVLRDNVRYRSRIERAYSQALGEARQDIILANAYFLPSRKIRRALVNAAQRGVRVRLLLQGRYDYFMSYHGTRALYGDLLAGGVEIYEYQSSFLHAKVAVVDERWATVGSSNIDPLSLLLAREANVVIADVRFAAALRGQLEQALQNQAIRLDARQHANRSVGQKLLDRMALLLMHVLLLLTGKRY
ncbi:cardiolipin synthase ClsB [Rhodoferax sp.]|uniref:cardiolipin synthase ClsB n=1 Tax=Rhodoferax sp. TaxID=50421 RepID=UPI0028485435|nr:cardiolipin synthase ClsB [Rhodoferax sp.]MDR3367747.1 cardiolipin synthase ClsB [Rhodoferax sp.]